MAFGAGSELPACLPTRGGFPYGLGMLTRLLLALFVLCASLGNAQSISVDRLYGMNSAVAIKAPTNVATTANINLSGFLVIDGVLVTSNTRVLVKDQSNLTQNGIYNPQVGAWIRTADLTNTRNMTNGTLVYVVSGTTQASTFWQLRLSEEPVTIGSTTLVWSQPSGNTPASINWYNLSNIPGQVIQVSNSGAITMAGISATNISVSSVLTAADASITTLTVGSCVGCASGVSWYGLANIPTQVQAVSNSGAINLSSLGVTGTVTATTLSGTFVYGNQASFTTINGAAYTTSPSWYAIQSIPIQVSAVSNSGDITLGTLTATKTSATFVYGNQISGTTLAGLLTTAAQTNVTNVGTLNNLGVTSNITATLVSSTFSYANQASYTTLTVGSCTGCAGTATAAGNQGNIQFNSATALGATSNLTLASITPTVVSLTGTMSSTFVYGNQASFTTLNGFTPTSTPSWYSLTNIPVPVQSVSNSGAIILNSLGVTNAVTATTMSATFVYGNQISGTTVAGTTGTFTNVGGTLSTAAQGNVTSLGTLTGLTVAGTISNSQVVRAWVSFSCAPSTCTILDGFNVSSVTYNAAGTHLVNIANALNSTVYGMGCTTQRSAAGDAMTCQADNQRAYTTTAVPIITITTSGEVRTDVTKTTVWVYDN